MTLRTQTIFGAALAGLLCSVAPAALAQTISTAQTQSSGISQEAALALSARLDALEQRNQELEQQILDLKTAGAANVQIVREQVNALPTVGLNNGRPQVATADGKFKFACARSSSSTPPTIRNRRAPRPTTWARARTSAAPASASTARPTRTGTTPCGVSSAAPAASRPC